MAVQRSAGPYQPAGFRGCPLALQLSCRLPEWSDSRKPEVNYIETFFMSRIMSIIMVVISSHSCILAIIMSMSIAQSFMSIPFISSIIIFMERILHIMSSIHIHIIMFIIFSMLSPPFNWK
jgi:hypothetical protein